MPLVLDLQCHPFKHDFGIGKIQTSFLQSFVALGWIKGDTHGYCIYKNLNAYFAIGIGGLMFEGITAMHVDDVVRQKEQPIKDAENKYTDLSCTT